MMSKKWPNLIIAKPGEPWVWVPEEHSADDYRLNQLMYKRNPAGLVFCRLGIDLGRLSESTLVFLLPITGCPHRNISLPTSGDPTTVCADCGGLVPSTMELSIFSSRELDVVCGEIRSDIAAEGVAEACSLPGVELCYWWSDLIHRPR
jgi:hypothetical protein